VAEEGLIVQRLDDELLVYDTASNEAHCLTGAVADEFEASDEVSRREVLRKVALASVAAVGGAPLVKTIAIPRPAHAQSGTCSGINGHCATQADCCTGLHCTGISISNDQFKHTCQNCLPAGLEFGCNASSQCCDSCCCSTEAGNFCLGPEVCAGIPGICLPVVSDRALKHHLDPVAPQDVLAALGL
jgi:hypothetical protein